MQAYNPTSVETPNRITDRIYRGIVYTIASEPTHPVDAATPMRYRGVAYSYGAKPTTVQSEQKHAMMYRGFPNDPWADAFGITEFVQAEMAERDAASRSTNPLHRLQRFLRSLPSVAKNSLGVRDQLGG